MNVWEFLDRNTFWVLGAICFVCFFCVDFSVKYRSKDE